MSGTTTIDPESNMIIYGTSIESSADASFDSVNRAAAVVIGQVTAGFLKYLEINPLAWPGV